MSASYLYYRYLFYQKGQHALASRMMNCFLRCTEFLGRRYRIVRTSALSYLLAKRLVFFLLVSACLESLLKGVDITHKQWLPSPGWLLFLSHKLPLNRFHWQSSSLRSSVLAGCWIILPRSCFFSRLAFFCVLQDNYRTILSGNDKKEASWGFVIVFYFLPNFL